jgi:hypothetical protein
MWVNSPYIKYTYGVLSGVLFPSSRLEAREMNYTKNTDRRTPPHPFRVCPSPYSLQLYKQHFSTDFGIRGHVINFFSDKQLGLLGIRHSGPYEEATFIGLLCLASLHGF